MDPKVIALVALVVGALVRLLKTDKLNETLASLGIPTIPKLALPWIALGLGYAAMVCSSMMDGASWSTALLQGLYGVISGALAVAGNETLKPAAHAVHEPTASMLFGKKS